MYGILHWTYLCKKLLHWTYLCWKWFVIYLKFTLNWASCISSGDPMWVAYCEDMSYPLWLSRSPTSVMPVAAWALGLSVKHLAQCPQLRARKWDSHSGNFQRASMASLAIWHKFKDMCVSSELWDRLHRKPYTTRVSGLVNVSFLSLCRKKNVIYSVCPFLWCD